MVMKARPWYRIWPEYVALVFGLGWIPFLPRPAVVALARFFGNAGFLFAGKLRRIGLENLDFAFGDRMTDREKRRLLRETFRHFSLLVLDVIWFTRKPYPRMERWIVWHESTRPMFDEQPQLMLTAHYGNWETLGQAFAARGARILSVAAPLKNAPVDRLFVRLRQLTGQVIIPQQGAARKLLQGLREQAKLAVLLDQNTRPRDGGLFVDFCGLPVPVSSAPAALAVKTKCRTLAVTSTPDAQGRYTVKVHAQLWPDENAVDPVHDLTQRMTHAMQAVILAEPQYWCWMYKRWRFIPEGQDRAKYPSYARSLKPDELPRAAGK